MITGQDAQSFNATFSILLKRRAYGGKQRQERSRLQCVDRILTRRCSRRPSNSRASPYERTDARKAHQNGYKDRSLNTRYGETILRKSQFREFPFETQVFGCYARVKKALVSTIVGCYLQGVSTRKIQEIVSHLGIELLSPASVSRMAKGLDDQVQAFLPRPIEQILPYLFVDASYYKVRDGV